MNAPGSIAQAMGFWIRVFFWLLNLVVFGSCPADIARAAELSLPARPVGAEPGGRFAARIAGLSLPEREAAIVATVLSGNVPGWLRRLEPVRVPPRQAGDTNVVTLSVASDYLAVGSDDDWFWVPLTPAAAQWIADRLECTLPTARMVDVIHGAAAVRLEPQPLAPGPEMITVPFFERHSGLVRAVHPRAGSGGFTGLVAGYKKDVVVSNRLTNAPGRVAIYGWHRTNGAPIQPMYVGHADTWVDYSHGVRLVANQALVNGRTNSVTALLQDATWAAWLSDEGIMKSPRYASRLEQSEGPAGTGTEPALADTPDEVWRRPEIAPQVRVILSEPAPMPSGRPVRLVIYALPNGSTIEQTVGRRPRPGDDWRVDIQHIGAQTRFLRKLDPGTAWVVAYVEANGLAWPAWRRRHADSSTRIVKLVEDLAQRYRDRPLRLVLAGHSGGGSFIFGYVNGRTNLPPEIERLAFLDANYAYDAAAGHAEKLGRWLEGGPDRFLTVLAYHDSVALLDGKPFVSEAGGTWGRSQRMLADLGTRFQFTPRGTNGLVRHSALDGRVQLWLKENPERKIWHTIQVERNGFIHALVCGTALEGRGYEYLGDRAYRAR